MRIEKLKHNFNVDIKLVHFPLHPDTPLEGRSMADLYAGRGTDPDEMYRQMKERMEAEGLPYGKRTHTYNSRKAQELGKWADTQDNGDALHDALYRAYFVDTKNIGDIDVLVETAGANGFDGAEVRQILEYGKFSAAVDEDWAKSRAYGVTGVPTYVAGGFGVVGAQPYEALEQLMSEVGAVKVG